MLQQQYHRNRPEFCSEGCSSCHGGVTGCRKEQKNLLEGTAKEVGIKIANAMDKAVVEDEGGKGNIQEREEMEDQQKRGTVSQTRRPLASGVEDRGGELVSEGIGGRDEIVQSRQEESLLSLGEEEDMCQG